MQQQGSSFLEMFKQEQMKPNLRFICPESIGLNSVAACSLNQSEIVVFVIVRLVVLRIGGRIH